MAEVGGGGEGVFRRTSVKGSASMCAISRGHWFKDVFPSAELHLGGLGGGRGPVLALAAGVYVLVDTDDPLLRLLWAQVVMNVLHSFCFFP